MDAATICEIAATAITIAGGGVVSVSRLTRIAVAAENLAEKLEKLTEAQAKTDNQVQEHEVRLAKGGL